MTESASRRVLEFSLVALFLVLACFQLFGRAPLGLPDNGDFAKIFGALKMGPVPEEMAKAKAAQARYFVPEYRIDPQFFYDARIPSSEFWVAKLAKRLALWFLPKHHFDLRMMGAVHLALLTAALWGLIRALRGRPLLAQFIAGLVLVFMFTDLEYMQFMSTGYADAASIVFFLVFLAVVVHLVQCRAQVGFKWIAGYTAIGTLFLSTKLQHQLELIPLTALALVFAWWSKSGPARWLWALPVLVFLGTTIFMASATRRDYRADPIYELVFDRLAPDSDEPRKVLAEFGFPDKYIDYVGVPSFGEDYLLGDPKERMFFAHTVPTSKIALYYLRHPLLVPVYLYSDLTKFATDVNLTGWEKRRFRIDDYARGLANERFRWWSSLRAMQATYLWWITPLLYAGALTIAVRGARNPLFAARWPLWPVFGLVGFAGLITFVVSSLNDCMETARHIILFQVATDLLFFFFALEFARVAPKWMPKARERSLAAETPAVLR